MTDEEYQEFLDWLEIGVNRNWVSEPVCATHNGLPNTEEEEKEWDDGHDPCVPGLRVWAL